MQLSKSFMIKLLTVLCVICCALALVFGVSACSTNTVESMYIKDGVLYVVYTDGTEEELGDVAGSDGTNGTNGTNGKDGADGENGKDGADGADGVGIASYKTEDAKDSEGNVIGTIVTITLDDEDASVITFTVYNGTDGEAGKNGEDGSTWYSGKAEDITKVEANVGDYYLATDTSAVYSYVEGTSGAEWVVVIESLAGADGGAGATGATGVGIASIATETKAAWTEGETSYVAGTYLVITLDDADEENNVEATVYYFLLSETVEETVCEHETTYLAATLVEASCTEAGLDLYVCTVCGSNIFVATEQLVHNSDAILEKKATCTEGGYFYYACSYCGEPLLDSENEIVKVAEGDEAWEEKYAETEALGHGYASVITLPTCDEDGYVTYTCSRCKDTFVVAYDAKEEEYYVVGNATADIELVYGVTVEDDITALIKEISDSGYNATALETAWVANEGSLVALGHSAVYNEKTKAWDGDTLKVNVVNNAGNICEDGGQILYVCAYCSVEIFYAEEVEAAGHVVDENWVVKEYPTTNATGSIYGFCSYCNSYATVTLPALSDESWTIDVTTDSSCVSGQSQVADYTIGIGRTSYELTLEDIETDAAHKLAGVAYDLTVVYDLSSEKLAALVEDGTITVIKNLLGDCTEIGYVTFNCSECGATLSLKVYGNHQYDETKPVEVVESTCEELGYKVYTCTVAGCPAEDHLVKVYDEDYAEHTYGETTFAEDTDTESGTDEKWIVSRTCEVCGYKWTIVADDFEVDETDEANVELSCVTDGVVVYNYTYTDENGDEQTGTFTITTKAIGHYVYSDEAKDEYVVFDFNKTYTYSEITELIEAFEKVYGEGKSPLTIISNLITDCTKSAAAATFVCSDCGETFALTVQGDHVYEKLDETQAATCTTPEYYVFECTVCDKDNANHYSYVAVPGSEALGHDYVAVLTEEEIVDEKTGEVTGTKIVVELTCSRCGDYIVADLDTTKGTYDVESGSYLGYEVVEPECDEQGYTIYYYSYTNKAGTTLVGEVKADFTETTEHYIEYYDTAAGETVTIYFITDVSSADFTHLTTEEAEAINEAAGTDLITVPGNLKGDCTVSGYATFYCAHCGEQYAILVQGEHVYGERVTEAATCEAEGYVYVVCSVCDKDTDGHILYYYINDEGVEATTTVKTAYYEALGHNFELDKDSVVDPTATTAGSITYICSRCEETFTIVLPALNDTDYTVTVDHEAECWTTGLIVYTYYIYVDAEGNVVKITLSVGDKGYDKAVEGLTIITYTVEVETETTDHKAAYETYYDYNGYRYYGYFCEYCGDFIVTSYEKLDEE